MEKTLKKEKAPRTIRIPVTSRIDQTNIDAKSKIEDIKRTCQESLEYKFRGVCVQPQWIAAVKEQLNGSDVKVICLVDAPIGDSSHEERMQVCKMAMGDGADELDVVASLSDIKHERWDNLYRDLRDICQILPTKVIIGSGYLTDQEIALVSRLVKQAGAICVKTATAKDPLEERELKEKSWHLQIMRKNAPGLLIKASGNIKNLKEAKAYIKAGADILGMSNGAVVAKGESD
jgi:deoxyribose-phosphate aldolase